MPRYDSFLVIETTEGRVVLDPLNLNRQEDAIPITTATPDRHVLPITSVCSYVGEPVSTAMHNRLGVDGTPEFSLYRHSHGRYGDALRTAATFMRRHSSGRYSSVSLMKIQRAYDNWSDGVSDNRNPLPVIILASLAYGYDEETEVKSGGDVGCLVAWPDKTLVAVAGGFRRKGIASALVACGLQWTPHSSQNLWVAQGNTDAQRFLLSAGFMPTAMNGTGALRYSLQPDQEETGVQLDQAGDDLPFVAFNPSRHARQSRLYIEDEDVPDDDPYRF